MGLTVARFASFALLANYIICYGLQDSYSETTVNSRR